MIQKVFKIEHKNIAIMLMGSLTTLFYFLAQSFPIQPINILELSFIDKSIPLIPWTIWPYVGLYPFLLIMAFSFKTSHHLNMAAFSFLVMNIIAFFIFMLFPIAYPRELYLIFAPSNLHEHTLNFLRNLDSPLNCLPSLHVANCFILSFWKNRENPKLTKLTLTCTLIISASTLTTKQHYIYDVITGFLLAWVVYQVFLKTIGNGHIESGTDVSFRP
jgi:membrane-associated phospholipid phosphatase